MEDIIRFLDIHYKNALKLVSDFDITKNKKWDPQIYLNELYVQLGHVYNVLFNNDEVNETKRKINNLGDELSDVLLQLINLSKILNIDMYEIQELKDYSYEKIQDYAFVQSLDLNMKNHLLYQANEYKLPFLEGYDSSSKEFKDALFLYFYDFFKKKYNLNLLCFPYDFIQQPIFEQTIYANDLDIVFDKNLDLVPYYINGTELKIIVDYLGNDSDYFYRGATKNSKGEFILENKNSIVDGKEYMVIVPEGLDKKVGFTPTRCGDTIHAVSFVFSSLEEAKRR